MVTVSPDASTIHTQADVCTRLSHSVSVPLAPTAPFRFDATVHKPDHFPSGDTHWEEGRRWQTMLWRGQMLGLVLENAGDVESPGVLLRIFSAQRLAFAHISPWEQKIYTNAIFGGS